MIMPVLIVNTYENKGGAAKATLRLFHGLGENKVDALMLVQNRSTNDPFVIIPGRKWQTFCYNLRPYVDFLIPLLLTRKRILFSTSLLPDTVYMTIHSLNPEVVHLNWIAGGMIKIESLSRISSPIVWTFHDLWAFTGGCHYPAMGCERFTEGCGYCPILHSQKKKDLSYRVFLRKQRVYEKIKELYIITPSNWLAGLVRKSPLTSGRSVNVIPNGLDIEVFKPSDRIEARKQFHLPGNKKILLFGAVRSINNELKGFHHLINALSFLKGQAYELVVFGASDSGVSKKMPVPTRFMGFISDESRLASLYAAADVVVVPSVQEVFGQTATEALACGIPVVAFANGGLTDIVQHMHNGYLARKFEPEDLASGIEWVLEDNSRYHLLSLNARETAVKHFDIRVTVRQTIALYSEITGSVIQT